MMSNTFAFVDYFAIIALFFSSVSEESVTTCRILCVG